METIIKRTSIFSLILGAFIALISVFPPIFRNVSIMILAFFTSVIIILFMKKNDKHLGIITNKQGALLGALIGFCSGIGFFLIFTPMICIIHLIFKSYYCYAIPDALKVSFGLYILIVLIVCSIFAMTNSASGMGVAWILDKIEKKPENFDAPLEIEIND